MVAGMQVRHAARRRGLFGVTKNLIQTIPLVHKSDSPGKYSLHYYTSGLHIRGL